MSKIKIEWNKAEGGKFLRNAGEYIVKLTDYEVDENDEGNQYIRWTIKVAEGPQTGATAKFITSLSYKSLWKLEDFLNAIQYPIERGSVQDLDLDDVLDKAKNFAIEFVEGREREDGKGYYLQAEDFMALDAYKEATSSTESQKAKETKEELNLEDLEKLIDEYDLDIDLEDYDTYDEAKAAIEKAISKAKKSQESEGKYTEEMIEALRGAELDKLANEIGLEFGEDDSPRSKRRSLIKALTKLGRME